MAGCGVHTDGSEDSQHNGIHRFFIGKNARVVYLEKHVGTGDGSGKRIINPQTVVHMDEGSYMEMDTSQIKGVDSTKRVTRAKVAAGAKLVIKEKIMTHGDQTAETDFVVDLDGANDVDAALIHEAAIGKIAGEQLIKLMTLGLTEEEAEAKIIEGFLK